MKKLARDQRRSQMLEIAQTIVRESGTDALTLALVAERAGVSKPIAYNHFVSRSGLLIALYRLILDQQLEALRVAADQVPNTLPDVAHVLATGSIDCHTVIGPEWHAIGAALKGDPEMDRAYQAMLDDLVDFFEELIAPLTTMDPAALRRRCVAIVGASEALIAAVINGGMSRDEAIGELDSMMAQWLPARPDTGEAQTGAKR